MLRTARHFYLESSDSAFLSYAQEILDDVTEAVFRKGASAKEAPVFDDDLLTAAFVALAYINLKLSSTRIAQLCLATNAPKEYKLAFVSACSFLARQPERSTFTSLFEVVSTILRQHLKVCEFVTGSVYYADDA